MLAILLLVRVTAHGAASIDDVVSVAGVTYTLLKNTDTSAKGFECVDSDVYCGKRSCKPPHPSDNPPCNITAIALTCSTTPHCTGFNSDGWLKPCVTKRSANRLFPRAYALSCDLNEPWLYFPSNLAVAQGSSRLKASTPT